MEQNIDILYQIQDLIQSAIIENPSIYLEEALHLLDDAISDIELSSLDYEDYDDENYIPSEN